MPDNDPRDQDSREREDAVRDREEDWLEIGRGGSGSVTADDDRTDREHGRRDRDKRDRDDDRGSIDPLDVFSRDLELPRGPERELVRDRNHHYRLNGSDTRTLSSVGAFRVVSERDLCDPRDTTPELRGRDLRHLERQGLIQRVPVNGNERAVALTNRGCALLERHRDPDADDRQQFYSGPDRPRERSHDAQFYRAYLEAAERLRDRGARIERVQLDCELKRDYQRFLQERNRGDRDSDGRPDRSEAEIAAWAREHNLPYFDEQVHFPDLRIEYEDANGDVRYEDIEVETEHYRGAHRASAARCGFSTHVSRRAGGGAFDPRVAEDFI
jgi:DNA-binding MarR family transcriptional regulator